MKTQYRLHCKLHCDSFALQPTNSFSLGRLGGWSVGCLLSFLLFFFSLKLKFKQNARLEQSNDRGFKRLIAHVSYGLKLGQHNCNCAVVFHLFGINLRNVNCFCSSAPGVCVCAYRRLHAETISSS